MPSSQLSPVGPKDRNHFVPTAASIHWVIRARETFQSQVPAEDSHPPTEGKVRVHPLDRCGAQGREGEAVLPEALPGPERSARTPGPQLTGTRPASHSLHRELPGRTLQVKRLYFPPLFPFPERDCLTGQSCLSDASKSAGFASCLCFTVCDYSKSDWRAAIRSKLITNQNTPNF